MENLPYVIWAAARVLAAIRHPAQLPGNTPDRVQEGLDARVVGSHKFHYDGGKKSQPFSGFESASHIKAEHNEDIRHFT